jgi:hypothetical protein
VLPALELIVALNNGPGYDLPVGKNLDVPIQRFTLLLRSGLRGNDDATHRTLFLHLCLNLHCHGGCSRKFPTIRA